MSRCSRTSWKSWISGTTKHAHTHGREMTTKSGFYIHMLEIVLNVLVFLDFVFFRNLQVPGNFPQCFFFLWFSFFSGISKYPWIFVNATCFLECPVFAECPGIPDCWECPFFSNVPFCQNSCVPQFFLYVLFFSHFQVPPIFSNIPSLFNLNVFLDH